MRVITKDFQRLKGENIFEFPVGITIIQGRSGSGKSTVFYAVEDCLTNPSGVSDVINWDAKEAEVTIENDGGYVKWRKTPSSCEYEDKNGKSFVKASKIDSRDIDNLGFYFDKKDDVVNIHGEWDKLFPFAASDTEMFKLFEDIFNISSSFQIIDNIKAEEKDYKAQIASLNNQINDLTIKNNSINDVLERVNPDVDSFIKDLQNKEQNVSILTNDYRTLSDNQKYLNIDIPKELDTSLLTEKGNFYSQILKDYENYQVNKQRASLIVPLEKSFDIKENPYIEDYNKYQTILNIIAQYEKELQKIDEEEKVVREKLGSIKVCPTCGQELKSGVVCC